MVDFFKALAEVVPNTPLFYYHIPMLTHCPVDLTSFLRAASSEIASLVGLKYTDNNMDVLKSLHNELGERFQLLNGLDEHYFDAVQLGLEAAVHASFNFAPGPFHRMRTAVAAGDLKTAQREQQRVMSLIQLIHQNASHGFTASLKDMSAAAGLGVGPSRLPLRSCGEAQIKILADELQALGFFQWQY